MNNEARTILAGLAMNGLLGPSMRDMTTVLTERDTGRPQETLAESVAREAVICTDALLRALNKPVAAEPDQERQSYRYELERILVVTRTCYPAGDTAEAMTRALELVRMLNP